MDCENDILVVDLQANLDENGKKKKDWDAYRKEQLGIGARGIFSERLRSAGFICYQNNDINWYKVVNPEIILAVSIFTDWPYFPASINVAFGAFSPIHPPKLPFKSLYTSNDGLWNDGMEDATRAWMRERHQRGISVSYAYIPGTQTKRLFNPEGEPDELDGIVFPLFQEGCTDTVIPYRKSFQKRDRLRKKGLPFIDECLYYKAEDQYPRCLELCNQALDWFYWTKEQRIQLATDGYHRRLKVEEETYQYSLENLAEDANVARKRKKLERDYRKGLEQLAQKYEESLAYAENWSIEKLPQSQQKTFADFEFRKAVLEGRRREEFEKSMYRRRKLFANKLERELGLVL